MRERMIFEKSLISLSFVEVISVTTANYWKAHDENLNGMKVIKKNVSQFIMHFIHKFGNFIDSSL